jgi:hypothetical protein
MNRLTARGEIFSARTRFFGKGMDKNTCSDAIKKAFLLRRFPCFSQRRLETSPMQANFDFEMAAA